MTFTDEEIQAERDYVEVLQHFKDDIYFQFVQLENKLAEADRKLIKEKQLLSTMEQHKETN